MSVPVDELYFPASHSSHVKVAATEEVPGGHSSTQPDVAFIKKVLDGHSSIQLDAPCSEYFPTSHALQGIPPTTYSPVPSVYLPAGQDIHSLVAEESPRAQTFHFETS